MSAKAAAKPKPPPAPPPEQGERTYLFLCLVALFLLLLVLLERDRAMLANLFRRSDSVLGLIPVLLGLGGLMLRWRITPLVLLVSLGGVLMRHAMDQPAWHRRVEYRSLAMTLNDLALCIAVLAFLAGFYRLQGLTVAIFPHDPRRRSAAGGPALARTRPERLVTAAELALLLGMLPFWAGLAHFLYPELIGTVRTDDLNADRVLRDGGQAAAGLVDVALRSRRLIFGLGGLALIASTVIGYLAWRRMSKAEAELALQDVVWEETRSEQRRIARWTAWGRLRASWWEDG